MKRKLLSMLFVVVLCLSLAVSAFAVSGADIYDEADLLSTQEETQLAGKLSEISEEFDAQIVIMTVSSTGGNIDAYIEEKFDSMNMGYGENRNGVLLLVCMDDREYRILSNGYAGEAIGMDQIDAFDAALAEAQLLCEIGEVAGALAALTAAKTSLEHLIHIELFEWNSLL